MTELWDHDNVARVCIEEYTRHVEFWPCARSNGVAQFTVLAGVVLVSSQGKNIKCIALGTGSKCLPATRLPKFGESLHDSHAEVVARRAAIRWFYQEIILIATTDYDSPWIQKGSLWSLKNGVEVWMYVSTLPCVFMLGRKVLEGPR